MLPNIENILYATDMSENSRMAFEYAVGLADRYKAQITVLHVIEPVNPNTYLQISSAMGEAGWVNLQLNYESSVADQLGAKLHQFSVDMELSTPAGHFADDRVVIRKGMPVEEIIETAQEKQADIIVMGTHGYGMVKDALMGGTARRVIRRSQIPVLIVPSSDRSSSP